MKKHQNNFILFAFMAIAMFVLQPLRAQRMSLALFQTAHNAIVNNSQISSYTLSFVYAIPNDATLVTNLNSQGTVNLYNIGTNYYVAPTTAGSIITIDSTDGMFTDVADTKVTSIVFENFDISESPILRNMFSGCSSLTMVDISGFYTVGVQYYDFMFSGCSSLTTIYVGSGFIFFGPKGYPTSSECMFDGCTSLVGEKGTTYDSDHLDEEYARIDNAPTTPGYFSARSLIKSMLQSALSNISGNYTLSFVNKIPADATLVSFVNAVSTTGLYVTGTNYYVAPTVDDKVIDAPNDCSSMFKDCSGLTTIDFSNFNTEGVTDMSSMFEGCSALTDIYVADFNTQSVTASANMFSGCTALQGVDGTKYDASNPADKTYARFDHGVSSPGYFALQPFDVDKLHSAINPMLSKDFTVSFVYSAPADATVVDNGDLNANGTIKCYKSNSTNDLYVAPTIANAPIAPSTCYKLLNGYYLLKSVNLTNLYTAKITNMNNMFSYSSGLSTITFPEHFNTSNVTDMGSMFSECNGLTSLDLSSFNTANVTTMNCMFSDCNSLQSLNLSSFNTEKVTDMGYMFMMPLPSTLTTLDLTSFNTKNVTNMDIMFYMFSSLKTIKVTGAFCTDQVRPTNMFTGCTNLVGGKGTTYDADKASKDYACIDGGAANPGYFTFGLPSVVLDVEQYWAVVNKDNNEDEYGKPEDIYAKQWTSLSFVYHEELPADVTEVSSLNTDGTLKLYRDADITTKYYVAPSTDGTAIMADELHATANNIKKDQNSHGLFESNTELTEINLGNFATFACSDMSALFKNCINLTSITFGNNFTTASVTDMNNMFYWCKQLYTLDITGFKTANVTKMNGMFDCCFELPSLNLSNINTAKVTDMSRMFWQCNQMEQIDLSKFNTAKVTNMSGMFTACISLTSLDLSTLNTASVTDMSDMFSTCSSLTTLDLSQLNTDQVNNMSGMFSYTPFTSLDLTNFNTANVQNMNYMFQGCTDLTSLTLDNFDMAAVDNYDGMFSDVNKENVSLTIKSLPYIASGLFIGDWMEVIYDLSDNSKIAMRCSNYPEPTQSPTYTRSMTNSWGTAVLPFMLKVSNNPDLTFYTLTAVDSQLSADGDGTLTFTALAEGDSIFANTPFVFMKNNDTATSVTFVGEMYEYETYKVGLWDYEKGEYVYDDDGNVVTREVSEKYPTAPYVDDPESVDLIDGITLYGTYETIEEQTGIYFIAQNQFWYAESPITIAPFRAWFSTGSSEAPARSYTIQVADGESTRLIELEDGSPYMTNDASFDLQGRRLGNSRTGLVIKNGRVIMVKHP